MINHKDLKMMTYEELKEFIKSAEQEIQNAEQEIKVRATALVKETKAKTVIAIRELVAVCKNAGIYRLGELCCSCDECGESSDFDILLDHVLEDVADILEE